MPRSLLSNLISSSFRTQHLIICIGCVLLCCGWASAQTGPALNNLAPPNFESFGVKDGLSDEIYSTIGMDENGFVWAGSASGLYRFDGYRWTRSEVGGANSLVRDMLSDPEGHLWALFEREGMAVNRNGEWSLTGDTSFYHRFNTTHHSNGSLTHWLGETDEVFQLQNARWIADPSWVPPGEGRITAVAQTERIGGGPRLWVARTRGSLWSRRLDDPDSKWTVAETGDFDGALYTDIMVSEDHGLEELWVLSYGSGILRLRSDGELRRWRKASGELPTEAIYSGVVTYDDQAQRSVWIASRGGLLRFQGDQLHIYDRSSGLPSNAVRGIKVLPDRDGGDIIWLASESGISRARLSPSAWRTVSRLGASENGIFGVFADLDTNGSERVVVGSGMAGLAVLSNGVWRHYTPDNSALPNLYLRGLWPVKRTGDLVLVSMDDGRLFVLDDALELIPIDVDWPLGRMNGVIDVVEFQDEIWIGTLETGIYRLKDRELELVHPPLLDDGLLQSLDVQHRPDGRSYIWGATSQGVVRISPSDYQLIQSLSAQNELSYRDVEVIREPARTLLWTSTERQGVVRYDISDPDTPRMIIEDTLPETPDPTIYSVTADHQGRIYICTNNGVQQLRPMPDGTYVQRVFRRQDGLVHDECNSRSQYIDDQDRFWVGTLAGLSMYDPALERPSLRKRIPSPLHLTRIEIDDQTIDPTSDSLLQIPAGTETLSVHTTLLTNHRESESEYRIMLDGLDSVQSDWVRQPFRIWSAPPPGDYLLRIEGRDFAGVMARPIEFQVQVLPEWFERPLVRLGLLIAALLSVIGIAALYNRRLRQRQSVLEALVEQRTQDLEHANRQLVKLSFKDPLTGAANRRRLDLAGQDALRLAAEQQQPVSLILLDLDYFKAFNDLHGHLAGDLALKCVAEQLAGAIRPGDLIARFGGEEFACLLPNTDARQAAEIAERAREAVIRGSRAVLADRYGSLTISAGVSTTRPGETSLKSLIDRADQALYQAKNRGRNQVVNSNGSGPNPESN